MPRFTNLKDLSCVIFAIKRSLWIFSASRRLTVSVAKDLSKKIASCKLYSLDLESKYGRVDGISHFSAIVQWTLMISRNKQTDEENSGIITFPRSFLVKKQWIEAQMFVIS